MDATMVDGKRLVDTVADLAASDPDLPEDVVYLVMAALEGGDELRTQLDAEGSGAARQQVVTTSASTPSVPPIGAYLQSIRVRGFRGAGPEARLNIHPAPGLTVVAGRNGSGKSTFAEALEMVLTRTSYRWEGKTSQWTSQWRNLHDTGATWVKVDLAEEGVGTTTVGLDWATAADWDGYQSWVQRAGKKRVSGLEQLGWEEAAEVFRPVLSYNELDGILLLPSRLHDALAAILGINQISQAITRLKDVEKKLSTSAVDAKERLKVLRISVQAMGDEPRAVEAAEELRKRTPSIDVIRRLVTGQTAAGEFLVEARVVLVLPEIDDVRSTAAALRAAVAAVSEITGLVVDLEERRHEILERAVEIHRNHGVDTCPVCGEGRLDASWLDVVEQDLASSNAEIVRMRGARDRLRSARNQVRKLIDDVPLPHVPDLAGTETMAAVATAWEAWRMTPEDDLGLADHVEHTIGDLVAAMSALKADVDRVRSERNDAWAPNAAQMAAWLESAVAAELAKPVVTAVKKAISFLKDSEGRLREERLQPLAVGAREIWTALRQESNIDLGTIRLDGQSKRRHVKIAARVDGTEAEALPIMSQGELHALALALFIPRATMDASPFRFVVLDDPIQAMDPAKVDGFARVLEQIAKDRQVIVFTHDDRLPEAVRRLTIDAHIVQVHRDRDSVITVERCDDPARRDLNDAFAIVQDGDVPDSIVTRVVPVLARQAVEAAARDAYMRSRYAAGARREIVEAEWQRATSTGRRLALVVGCEVANLGRWLGAEPRRRTAYTLVTKGAHKWESVHRAGIQDDLRAVQSLVVHIESL